MICPGTKRPPLTESELESVPAEADGGRATRGVEYFGTAGTPEPEPPPMPSLVPADGRAPDGARAGATGAGESNVTPSVISAALSSVVASLKLASSVRPIATGSSPRYVVALSESAAVEAPHEEQNRAFGETVLPQDEQNMERRFYQRSPPETTP